MMQENELKPKQKNKSGRIYTVLLAIIIAAVSIFNIYLFLVKHTAFHEDEYFNFALANSYKKPFLYGSGLQHFDNIDNWMTGDDFKYYVRVNDDTKFRYDSVWSNQAEDTNPPLQYAITHTLCSIYQPDNYWIYGYIINILCLIFLLIYLYLLVIELCRSRAAGLVSCAFWGFSLVGQADVQFIRMYIMLTLFTVMYSYYSLRLMRMENVTVKNLIPVAVTAFLGAMTQHLFLPFAFFITFFECAYFFFVKKRGLMLKFGIAALIGILLSIAAFPAVLTHLSSDHYVYSGEAKLDPQLRIFFRLLMLDTFGYYLSLDGLHTYLIASLFIIPLAAPFLFVFRKEPWIKKFFSKVKSIAKKCADKLKPLKNTVPCAVILAIASGLSIITVAARVHYFEFGSEAVRYLYHVSPFVCAIPIAFLFWIAGKLKSRSRFRIVCGVAVVGLAAVIIRQNIIYEPKYLLSADTDNGRIHDYVKGKSGILLPLNPIYMPSFCGMFEDSNDVYTTMLVDEYYDEPFQWEEYKKLIDRNEEFFLCFDCYNFINDDDRKKYEELLAKKEKGVELPFFDRMFFESYDEENSVESFIKRFEEKSGYKAEYCTTEKTHYLTIKAYMFKPQQNA